MIKNIIKEIKQIKKGDSMMTDTEEKKHLLSVTICGGGNGAHTAAAYISSNPAFRVNVLTRRPAEWSKCLKIDTSNSSWSHRGDIFGFLNKVSDDPSEVIGDSDIVLLVAPANAHREMINKIKPYLHSNALLGTIFAQGGFDWLAHSAFHGNLSQIGGLFGLQNIPWLCRIKHYGREVQLLGPKLSLRVAAFPSEKTKEIAEIVTVLFDIPAFPLPNFMTLTLTPSNQIIHPALYYSIFHKWDGKKVMTKDEIQWGLYSEIDELAAFWMEKLDRELQSIKLSLVDKFPYLDLSDVLPLGERIIQQYGDGVLDTTNLRTIIATNKGYSGFITPVQPVEGGYIPALKSRLFWEDIPFGLCILKNIAELLSLETPSIDFMIEWHQQFMNKKYLINGKLNPQLIHETACPAGLGINTLEELIGFSLSSSSVSLSSSNLLKNLRKNKIKNLSNGKDHAESLLHKEENAFNHQNEHMQIKSSLNMNIYAVERHNAKILVDCANVKEQNSSKL